MKRVCLNLAGWLLGLMFCLGCEPDNVGGAGVELDGPGALVVTTDYQTGAYGVIEVDSRVAHPNVDLVHQDAVCRFDEITGQVYILRRLGSDAIDVVSPDSAWRIVREYSVGAGSNPRDIAVVSPTRAYVARYAESELLVINPADGTEIDRVDISAYADADGVPEMAWIQHLAGKVYLLLQRLDRPGGFVPTEYSSMLVIDAASGVVESEVRLSATNPVGKLRYNAQLERFVIVSTGTLTTINGGTVGDGGIEYFDPVDNTVGGLVIGDGELGGDIVDAVIVSPTKGYGIVGVVFEGAATTVLVSFDPTSGRRLDTVARSDGWSFSYLELSPNGDELWLADGALEQPGVRIFDTQTDLELTDIPLDVGLPPYMICFDR